jgi:CAAX prenyl protease-like protein
VPVRRGHGWWPYLLPMFSFLLLGEISGRLPEAMAAWFLAPRVLVPAALLVYFFRQGEYPELRTPPPGGAVGLAQDALVGLVGAAIWMVPMVWLGRDAFPEFLRPAQDAGFDPTRLGEGFVGLALTLRFAGYAAVTPFAEELFVRSWLARWLVVFDSRRDFRSVPIAEPSLRSFLGVVLFFTVSHVPWEWPVAVLWVVGTQIWFYRRRHLGSVVVVHATSNLAIFVAVLLADRAGLDLWYFL